MLFHQRVDMQPQNFGGWKFGWHAKVAAVGTQHGATGGRIHIHTLVESNVQEHEQSHRGSASIDWRLHQSH